MTYLVLASPAMAFFAHVALGLAAWRLLVPVDFTVDEGGVKQQWLRCRRYDGWNSFRAFSSLADGFVLWRSENACPLDADGVCFCRVRAKGASCSALLRRHWWNS